MINLLLVMGVIVPMVRVEVRGVGLVVVMMMMMWY